MEPAPAPPLPTLDDIMARDRVRLAARWRRLRDGMLSAGEAASLRKAINASAARRVQRMDRVPEIRIDESLPITARAADIIAALQRDPVLILAGETGSGKSTQLPKLCLAAGRGIAGMVGCTQPRRIAARALSRRVAGELGPAAGAIVGFRTRFADEVPDEALVKFMTDGILLAEAAADPLLTAYDTLVLDEAHERSLNIDFLLGYLKKILPRRRDLRVVVTSATLDTSRLSAHFGGAPVIEVEGRAYPVEVRWRGRGDGPAPAPPQAPGARRRRTGSDDGATEPERIAAIVDEVTREDPRGDILVFLPGEREIRDAHLVLARRRHRATEILPLYARLSAREQDRVFHPESARRIVLATNVAETSLTVPRIRYVIDTGTARIKRYSPRSAIERLHVEPVSQAAADQRKGRCGRVGPGICYRLYSEADFERRPRYSDPEILRSSLAGVILRMLSLRLGDPERFPFIDRPEDRAFADGYRRLAELGALAASRPGAPVRTEHHLSDIGRQLARLPVDVALGRILIEGNSLGALRELLVLAAFLGIQDPRERPADRRADADAMHAAGADPESDFTTILNLWRDCTAAQESSTRSELRAWCESRFLSYPRVREWRELHRQLLLTVDAFGWTLPDARVVAGVDGKGDRERYESVHCAILSGWPTQVGHRGERGVYHAPRNRRFTVFPASALARKPPTWILAAQLLDLGSLRALTCARVEPRWIERQAGHLVRRSWHDVHFSRARGAVVATEEVTLFGLVLASGRQVAFGGQDPALAHHVFVEQALARCDIDARADFIAANAAVLAAAREREAQARRLGLVRPEHELAAFFDGKLPVDIQGAAALDAWYRRASAVERRALRWSLDDVLVNDRERAEGAFPPALDIGGQSLRFEYRFVPGDPDDGITLHVPVSLLNAVPASRCEWLVPGLLAEKVAALLKALPKALRRHCVPAPDFAAAFVAAEPPRDEPLVAALARFLTRVTGAVIEAADFAGAELPAWQSMNFHVHDEQGALLATGRDLAALRDRWGDAARRAFASRAATGLDTTDVTAFDFDDLPRRVVGEDGLDAFPALVDLGESAALETFENPADAEAAHVQGVARLLRIALTNAVRQAARQLPVGKQSVLSWAAFGAGANLRDDVVEGALRDGLAAIDLDIRTAAAFAAARGELAHGLFAGAMERLAIVEAVLAARAGLGDLLEPPLIGYARASYDDLAAHLATLLAPGFVRDVPIDRLRNLPRYVEAAHRRAERLRRDAPGDQSRLLRLAPVARECAELVGSAAVDPDRAEDLRWLLEEWRVSLFAQELGTAVVVSAKRIAKVIAELRAAVRRSAS
ncbi:MAG: ATP-dependent RNA helicase HrpA [Lysobacterales bacterium]